MTEMSGSRDFFVFDIKNVNLRKAKLSLGILLRTVLWSVRN